MKEVSKAVPKYILLLFLLILFALTPSPALSQLDNGVDCLAKLSGFTIVDLNFNGRKDSADFLVPDVKVRLSRNDTSFKDEFTYANSDGYWETSACIDTYTVTVETAILESQYNLTSQNREVVEIKSIDQDTELLFYFNGTEETIKYIKQLSLDNPSPSDTPIPWPLIGITIFGFNILLFFYLRYRSNKKYNKSMAEIPNLADNS